MIEKPFLGVEPRWLVIEKRLTQLVHAVERWVESGQPLPLHSEEWESEIADCVRWLRVYRARMKLLEECNG